MAGGFVLGLVGVSPLRGYSSDLAGTPALPCGRQPGLFRVPPLTRLFSDFPATPACGRQPGLFRVPPLTRLFADFLAIPALPCGRQPGLFRVPPLTRLFADVFSNPGHPLRALACGRR